MRRKTAEYLKHAEELYQKHLAEEKEEVRYFSIMWIRVSGSTVVLFHPLPRIIIIFIVLGPTLLVVHGMSGLAYCSTTIILLYKHTHILHKFSI